MGTQTRSIWEARRRTALAFWNIEVASMSGDRAAITSQSRLCSLSQMVCIDVKSACSFTRRSPAMKKCFPVFSVVTGNRLPAEVRSLHEPGSRSVLCSNSGLGL